jgi:hypothetical protein
MEGKGEAIVCAVGVTSQSRDIRIVQEPPKPTALQVKLSSIADSILTIQFKSTFIYSIAIGVIGLFATIGIFISMLGNLIVTRILAEVIQISNISKLRNHSLQFLLLIQLLILS